jgi:hypothetical protein
MDGVGLGLTGCGAGGLRMLRGTDMDDDRTNYTYRVHMHTAPSPGATYYSGHVDVLAVDEEQAAERAKREAYRKALHTRLVVDRIERQGGW